MLILIFGVISYAQVHVNGYYRKNGTYVQPHMRSSPDNNPYNNYSYPGNVNPYTGKTATGNESTYLNNYYNNKSTDYSYIPKPEERLYYYDKKGNGNGEYLFKYEESPLITKYWIYNISDTRIGYINNYYDGDTYIYDINDKLLKRIKLKKKKGFN